MVVCNSEILGNLLGRTFGKCHNDNFKSIIHNDNFKSMTTA